MNLVALIGNYAGTAALLTAFDMQLDPDQPLPLPQISFAPPVPPFPPVPSRATLRLGGVKAIRLKTGMGGIEFGCVQPL